MARAVVPLLIFDGAAEEALRFDVSVFKHSAITGNTHERLTNKAQTGAAS